MSLLGIDFSSVIVAVAIRQSARLVAAQALSRAPGQGAAVDRGHLYGRKH
jgi:hypothetical protein